MLMLWRWPKCEWHNRNCDESAAIRVVKTGCCSNSRRMPFGVTSPRADDQLQRSISPRTLLMSSREHQLTGASQSQKPIKESVQRKVGKLHVRLFERERSHVGTRWCDPERRAAL